MAPARSRRPGSSAAWASGRGRRDGEHLAAGDTLDCWRVEAYEPDERLRLAAEMKLPGRGWLDFEVIPRDAGASTIRQTAVFDARGIGGRCYWYALYPIHVLLFAGLLRAIAHRAIGEAGNPRDEDRHRPRDAETGRVE